MNEALFKCNACGEVVTRQLGWKLWTKSLCTKTGKMARLYRISAPTADSNLTERVGRALRDPNKRRMLAKLI